MTMRGLKSQLNVMMRKANRALVAARSHVKAGDYTAERKKILANFRLESLRKKKL